MLKIIQAHHLAVVLHQLEQGQRQRGQQGYELSLTGEIYAHHQTIYSRCALEAKGFVPVNEHQPGELNNLAK